MDSQRVVSAGCKRSHALLPALLAPSGRSSRTGTPRYRLVEIRLNGPVLAEDAGKIAVIDGFEAILVQPRDQIMKERVHRLIAPAGSLSIEPCNPLAGVLTFGELPFGVRDAFSSFAELPKRLLAAVTVLVTSRGRTCNEDVCADVQRSNVKLLM